MGDFWGWFNGFAAPKLGAREKTFRKMFEYLDAIDRPARIWETGCVRDPTHWELAGCSTYLFDRYVVDNGGEVISVDINQQTVERCRGEVSKQTAIHCGDSVEFLTRHANASWVPPIDLLYLDSWDMEWHNPVPSAHHHLKEFMAILPVLRPETLVAVDDSPVVSEDFQPRVKIGGKGEFVARYCHSVGADTQFTGYQVGFSNVTRKPELTGESVEDLIRRARWNVEHGNAAAASHLYDLVLMMTPPPWSGMVRIARGEACAFFARIATNQNLRGVAGDWYRTAIECDPLAVDYRLEFAGRVLLNMGSYTGAINETRRATNIEPGNYRTWAMLGGILHEDNQAAQAVIAYDKAIEVVDETDPDAVAAVKMNRSTIALDMADYGLTEKLCNDVIAGGTDRVGDAKHVLALAEFRQSLHEKAADTFLEALKLGARDPGIVRWHRSHALEAVGRYREASVEREQRSNQNRLGNLSMPMKRFARPVLPALWDGNAPPVTTDGRRTSIHVHTEAGSGDNFALARYVPILAEMGYDVRYEVMSDMFDLMRHSFDGTGVTVVRVAPDYPGSLRIEPFNFHCPIGSLMHAMGTEVDRIPWRGPYLKADQKLVEHYRKQLRLPLRKVGVCWSSGIIRDRDVWLESYGRRKSMHLKTFAPVLHQETCVSLQVGPERAQIKEWEKTGLVDLLPEHPTWADTAALIECLDLVVTVDTGVAHLAGAMGKPTWVMTQRNSSSWHFMCWRPGAAWNERSPWYPNTRVFRQHKFDEYRWDEVVRDVAEELELHERLDERASRRRVG
jgi:tetratricopeptide (TPR) repeat protein